MKPHGATRTRSAAGLLSLVGLVACVRPSVAQDPVSIPGAVEPARSKPAGSHDPPSDRWLGGIFLGSLGVALVGALDEVDEAIDPLPASRDQFYRSVPRTAGRTEIAAGLSGATLLAGLIAGSETTARVGVRSLESVLTATAITAVVKVGLGRARPDSGIEEGGFQPFAFSTERWSFPSGHTANAFSLAATVSRELGDEAAWVPFVAYPMAGMVGVSRLLDDKHWLTDVLAGAAVGIFSSHIVGRLHPAGHVEDAPEPLPRLLLSAGDGLVVGLTVPLGHD